MRDIDEDVTETVPQMEWEPFLAQFRWAQGEHVALIGNTGCGKTTLAHAILPIRKNVVAFGTKPKSESLEHFMTDSGFTRISAWPDKSPNRPIRRRMLWPRINSRADHVLLRKTLDKAFDSIFYHEGAWCVYLDEVPYLTDQLKLGHWVSLYMQQGREIGITLVVAMQRPKFVPLTVYTNSTHLFFWREKDWSNLQRISEIGAIDTFLVREIVTQLEEHEFLYINSRTGTMVRGMAPAPKGG